MAADGIDLFAADKDSRTALHLAASEGHSNTAAFLINAAPVDKKAGVLSAADRWGGTPLGDAIAGGHQEVVKLLKIAGAKLKETTVARQKKTEGDVMSSLDSVRPFSA